MPVCRGVRRRPSPGMGRGGARFGCRGGRWRELERRLESCPARDSVGAEGGGGRERRSAGVVSWHSRTGAGCDCFRVPLVGGSARGLVPHLRPEGLLRGKESVARVDFVPFDSLLLMRLRWVETGRETDYYELDLDSACMWSSREWSGTMPSGKEALWDFVPALKSVREFRYDADKRAFYDGSDFYMVEVPEVPPKDFFSVFPCVQMGGALCRPHGGRNRRGPAGVSRRTASSCRLHAGATPDRQHRRGGRYGGRG